MHDDSSCEKPDSLSGSYGITCAEKRLMAVAERLEKRVV